MAYERFDSYNAAIRTPAPAGFQGILLSEARFNVTDMDGFANRSRS